jgi:hypothetical protein
MHEIRFVSLLFHRLTAAGFKAHQESHHPLTFLLLKI